MFELIQKLVPPTGLYSHVNPLSNRQANVCQLVSSISYDSTLSMRDFPININKQTFNKRLHKNQVIKYQSCIVSPPRVVLRTSPSSQYHS